MKRKYLILPLLCISTAMAAQNAGSHDAHASDSTDMFHGHLRLGEAVVVGLTGQTRLKDATAPVTLVRPHELRAASATNIVDAIAHLPGLSQITTGGAISKPIIRGLGYNRVVSMFDGVRQEGQQWGDEHGLEIDDQAVGSVEVLKGPASIIYGSDALAGVVLMRSQPLPEEGTLRANAATEYQTNNGLFGYSLNFGGKQRGIVFDARLSQKMAHAYKNRRDGYVPGSQFSLMGTSLMAGLDRDWGHSLLRYSYVHLTPSIIEGERDDATGELTGQPERRKTYGKALPFQQVHHHKITWDNSLILPQGTLSAIVAYQQNRRQEYEESADECALYFKLHTLSYDLRFHSFEQRGWRFAAGVGGMVQRSKNLGEEYLIPDYRLFDVGVYATLSRRLGPVVLNGGLRYDHRSLGADELEEEGTLRFAEFERHFNALSGSLGAVWNIGRQMNLRLNLARAFRTPNMSELASNGVHEGSQRYELGNERLKAEHSLQADLGFDLNLPLLTAQVALFANRIDNYIYAHRLPQVVEPGHLTYAYTQGDASLVGFEVGADFHPVHAIHFENTFSMVNARLLHQPRDMKYLPMTPAPRWTSEIKWEITHHSHPTLSGECPPSPKGLALNNLYVALGMECYLRQSHIMSADQTETPTPSYTLFSLSLGTDLQLGGRKVAEVHITAQNLFDRVYQDHLSRLKYAPLNPLTGRQGIANMGRNIALKLIVPLTF